MSTINPELTGGFRDYLPAEAIPRQRMFDTIRSVFERFGFLPLDTPALEKEEVLTGGDSNFKMQIFRARLREEEENLALRFDLTVPLARVVALYPNELDKPFKRYQVGPVWRGEKPQAGRFREFVQFDADIVGSARPAADAEIIAIMYETMVALGVKNFLIRVNNRKILNGLSEFVGFDGSKTNDVLRQIDKLDRFGWDNVSGELKDQEGLSDAQLQKLKSFLDFRGGSAEETIAGVRALMADSATAQEGLSELSDIANYLQAMGVPDSAWKIDLSVARGLGYYTGPVFETVLTDMLSIGSVFSGGRYDNLVERFSSVSIPATGASVGVDRLFLALSKLGILKSESTVAQVFLFNFEKECETDIQRLATSLRREGIPAEVYLGKEITLKGQLAYALKRGFSVALIMGLDEKGSGEVAIKDVRNRKQWKVPQAGVVNEIQKILQ